MRIYFFSETECALLANGLFLGKIDGFERSFDVSLTDELFLSCLPTSGIPISFFLSPNIMSAPPKGTKVYVHPDFLGIGLLFTETRKLTILNQLEENGLFTLFDDGILEFSIEADSYHVLSLPHYLKTAKIRKEGNLIFLEGESGVACIHLNGNLLYTLPLKGGKAYDCIGREISYRLGETLSLTLSDPTFLPDQLPFAFLEAVRLKADLSPYLSKGLLDRKEELYSFFPPFMQTLAPPSVLIKKTEYLYSVLPVTFTYLDGKIDNVKI